MLGMLRDFQYERKISESIASVSFWRLEGSRWVLGSLLVVPAVDIEREHPVFEEAIWI